MTRIEAFAFLIAALFAAGCNSAPAPRPTELHSDTQRSRKDDEFNRTYQTETHHRHHHGRRSEASDDTWTSYDRPETANPSDGSDERTAHSSRHHNSRALTAAPGQFDYYLLNLSWSPEFCHGHPAAAECVQHRAFTLHGLWPQNSNGTYPEDCSEAAGPADPSQYADIYPDATLLQHEWQTHGTCSGLSPDAFLNLARRAEQSVRIPDQLAHLTAQTSLAPAQIIARFTLANPSLPASSIAISCGNNYLTAVEVCLDKNLKATSCSALKSCGANEVRVPAPQE